MSTVFAIASVVILTCLLLATGMYPPKSIYSLAELKRRQKHNKSYKIEVERYKLHSGLVFLLQITRYVLLVALSWLVLAWLGWIWGSIVMMAVIATHSGVARILLVRRGAEVIYTRIEPGLLRFIAKFKKVIYAFLEPGLAEAQPVRKAHSLEDLIDIIEQSTDVISEKDRQLITSAFDFFDKPVYKIMTPRKEIDFIKHSEFLGPLVLNELHSLGHSQLPVVAKDIDSIVGVLNLSDVVSLDVKQSVTAEKTMKKRVIYLDKNDSLEQALNVLVDGQDSMAIIRNKDNQTVGLVTLKTIIDELIGRQISTTDNNLLK